MHVSSTARRYGRSLARVAIEKRLEKTVLAEIQGLLEYFRDHPMARLTLESPASTKLRQVQLIEAIEGAVSLSEYVRNFLRLLVEEGRFHLFREIVEAYRQESDRWHGIVEVEVTTAQPLDEAQREALRGTIQRSIASGREVRLDLRVDPALVAGVVTRVGSVVHDGSLAHQLTQLRQQLISE